jgi:Escherichia/Staphylococcus phage prohead protease
MQREIRSFELRAADGVDFVLEGTAVSYDCLSQELSDFRGSFRERIMPGAFTRSLKEGADVKCLFNHDQNFLLGRTKSGTLQLQDTPKGLRFRCQLDQNNSTHRDIYASVKRRDLSECSFAFIPTQGGDTYDQVTENGKRFRRRTVTDADLFDCSVVVSPAYNAPGATSVDARNTDAALDAYHRRRAAEIGREIAAADKAAHK